MAHKFKVGDKCISLSSNQNDLCQKRIKGHIYTVEAVMYCKSCGLQMINIGQKSETHKLRCCICNSVQENDGLRWTRSKLFAPIEELNNILEEAIKEENYELCQILVNNNLKQ